MWPDLTFQKRMPRNTGIVWIQISPFRPRFTGTDNTVCVHIPSHYRSGEVWLITKWMYIYGVFIMQL